MTAIAYATTSLLTGHTNTGIDQGYPGIVIPLVVTDYQAPSRKLRLSETTTLPIVNGSTAYGGSTVIVGPNQNSKLTCSGFVDTPISIQNGWPLPSVQLNGVPCMYMEFIIAAFEGRLNQWSRVEPIWFRDPYDRVYTNPKVFDVSASYTAGVPGRVNFQLTLVI